MTHISRKLIVEAPIYEYNVTFEEQNRDTEKRIYITGPYMQYDTLNKNNRKYLKEEMLRDVERFNREMIDTGRAGGELGHSTNPEIDLSKLCHKIVGLKHEESGKHFIGKSMILSTPSGKILESLIKDGVRTGMSTKALGQIQESEQGNVVNNFYLVGVDAVYDPSYASAFVNGILESKEFIINSDNRFEEVYEKFQKGLGKYPSQYRDDINKHIQEQVLRFLNSI